MGVDLLKTVIQATELPEKAVEKELYKLVSEAGYDNSDVTLDQLREVMVQYLQTVFLELIEDERPFNQVS